MEPTFEPPGSASTSWGFSSDVDRLAQRAILVVEDDRDIREMLSTLLDMAGFTVHACGTAEGGLNALREQDFDLILTDYALPRHSGLWLLQQAEDEDLIDGTPVIIVTAHPQVEGIAKRYEVIQKPFDLDELVERVRYRMEGDGPRRRRPASIPVRGDGQGTDDPGCPAPVELILYVSKQSPGAEAAVRNIEKMLKHFDSGRVKLTVRDLAQAPVPAGENAIAFTVVGKTPTPRTLILGHVTNPELIVQLLAECEPGES